MVPGQLSLSLNVSKTKELIVDFRKRHLRPYTPLMISGTPVERVSSFKYLGVNISEDLTWTTHIQTQVKKARQRLYHLRQLRKFRVSPTILKTFYSGTIESVFQCGMETAPVKTAKQARAEGGGGGIFPLMPKVPFCQGNYYYYYFIKRPFVKACPI